MTQQLRDKEELLEKATKPDPTTYSELLIYHEAQCNYFSYSDYDRLRK